MAQLLLLAILTTATTVMMTVTAVMMTVLMTMMICLSVVELVVLTVGHRPVFCHGFAFFYFPYVHQ
jgi:hypothetical protein